MLFFINFPNGFGIVGKGALHPKRGDFCTEDFAESCRFLEGELGSRRTVETSENFAIWELSAERIDDGCGSNSALSPLQAGTIAP